MRSNNAIAIKSAHTLLPSQILGFDKENGGLVFIERILRYRHLYLLGKPGTGKSTLIHNLALRDIKNDKAVVVVDPAGDLCIDILSTIPERRINDVLYFSLDSPLPYNILQTKTNNPGKLINEFIELIDNVVSTSSQTEPLSARMKRVLRKCLFILVNKPDVTLSDIERFLTDKRYRVDLIDTLDLHDSGSLSYWESGGEFDKSKGKLGVSIDGLLDRIDTFLMDNRVKKITCGQNEIDFDDILENHKILLVDLGGFEGGLKHFVGNLIVHGIQTTVLERPRSERKPLAFYLDEFQNYISPGFEKILSEGRKYKISLCLSHQNHDQIPPELLGTVLGCVGSSVVFRCGAKEARRMAGEFVTFDTEVFLGLNDFKAIARINTEAKYIETLPAPKKMRKHIKVVRQQPIEKPPMIVIKDEIGWGWMTFDE